MIFPLEYKPKGEKGFLIRSPYRWILSACSNELDTAYVLNEYLLNKLINVF